MTERERLIELFETVPADEAGNRNVGVIAEYLLAHGVLLPPCKVEDPLWWFSEDDDESEFDCYPAGVYEDPDGVRVLAWDGHEWYVLIEGEEVPIGTQYAFLTSKEAERALAERMKANDR